MRWKQIYILGKEARAFNSWFIGRATQFLITNLVCQFHQHFRDKPRPAKLPAPCWVLPEEPKDMKSICPHCDGLIKEAHPQFVLLTLYDNPTKMTFSNPISGLCEAILLSSYFYFHGMNSFWASLQFNSPEANFSDSQRQLAPLWWSQKNHLLGQQAQTIQKPPILRHENLFIILLFCLNTVVVID